MQDPETLQEYEDSVRELDERVEDMEWVEVGKWQEPRGR